MLLLTVMVFAAPASAQQPEGEPLFVGDARVDVLGKNANDARTQAFAEGQRIALEGLLQKFVPDQSERIMKDLTDEAINPMVKSVEVAHETIDGARYRADLNISFSARAFQKLIESNLKAVRKEEDLLTPATLVLPLFDDGEKLKLFEASNLWGEVWRDVALATGAGYIVMPYSDSIDQTLVAADKAMTTSHLGFSPLARRYGARDVIVLSAKFATVEGERRLEVTERRVGEAQDGVKILVYPADFEEEDKTLMRRAALDIAKHITAEQRQVQENAVWKQKKLVSQLITTPITTMQRFAELQRQLVTVSGVAKVEILAVSPAQADLRIQYQGEKSAVQEAMRVQRLKVEDRGEYWIVVP